MPLTPHATVAAQTREILLQLDGLLKAAGSHERRLLKVSTWLAEMAAFEEMNPARAIWVPHDALPARAMVEARIANPAWRVEIAAAAALAAGSAHRHRFSIAKR